MIRNIDLQITDSERMHTWLAAFALLAEGTAAASGDWERQFRPPPAEGEPARA